MLYKRFFCDVQPIIAKILTTIYNYLQFTIYNLFTIYLQFTTNCNLLKKLNTELFQEIFQNFQNIPMKFDYLSITRNL